MIYKNLTGHTRSFHGVEFAPGAVKEVNGVINVHGFVQVFDKSLITPDAAKEPVASNPAEKPAAKSTSETKKATTTTTTKSKTTTIKEVTTDGTNSNQ